MMRSTPIQQQGVALFMSLVMLLILTILGLSSVQTTSLQEVMARNAQDTNLAFHAAESAIRDAEEVIEAWTEFDDDEFGDDTVGYFREVDAGVDPNWFTVDFANDVPATGGYIVAPTAIPNVAIQPRYVIEYIGGVESELDQTNETNDYGTDLGEVPTQMFRITTWGTGGTSTAKVMLQATYGRRF